MQVPPLDLKSQYARIKAEVDEALKAAIDSQHFVLGPTVEKLEQELAQYLGVKHAIAVASGSDALLIALMALDIKPGDKVVTTPFTFFATAGSIARLGARPVFVDIDVETYNIDPAGLKSALAKHKKVKAIIPVHLYGQCADMTEIIDLGKKHKIPVIEDAAQSIGATYTLSGKKHQSGTMTELGAFSFYPTKNLGGWGDGGMITTNDGALAKMLKYLRVHGAENRYYHKYIGLNSRLDAIQAAILRVKLKYIDQWNKERNERAGFYARLVKENELSHHISIPVVKNDRNHIFHQYTIKVLQDVRDGLLQFLKLNGIGCEVYYPLPLHLQECFGYLGYKKGDFPVSEKAAQSVLSLPMYPELTEEKQKYVVEKIHDFYCSSAIWDNTKKGKGT